MGTKTSISWTDATWNPWHGYIKVSQGCKQQSLSAKYVMPRDIQAWTSKSIVLEKFCPTSASTRDCRIWLSRLASAQLLFAVLKKMCLAIGNNFEILWTVISFDLVDMVDNLLWQQRATNLRLSHHNVLVYVTIRHCPWMLWATNKYIAIGSNAATTTPSRM